jgi:hypothetical protein
VRLRPSEQVELLQRSRLWKGVGQGWNRAGAHVLRMHSRVGRGNHNPPGRGLLALPERQLEPIVWAAGSTWSNNGSPPESREGSRLLTKPSEEDDSLATGL